MADRVVTWGQIPHELRVRDQWLIAGPDDKGINKAPYTIGHGGIVFRADPTNTALFLPFDKAAAYAWANNMNIGFVLADTDPYTCIDLDVKNAVNEPDAAKWTSVEAIDAFKKYIEHFGSYTERSQSGQGYHIWVKGVVGPGLKFKGVEVYDRQRFIVSTGDHVANVPIADRAEMVAQMLDFLREQRVEDSGADLVEGIPERMGDNQIYERLSGHSNAEKFLDLLKGDWAAMRFPSQSEADMALMSMLTFYSENNDQCRRIFRHTALGQRAKATKNDAYLNRTLSIIRGREAREKAAAEQGARLVAGLLSAQANRAADVPLVPELTVAPVEVKINIEKDLTLWPPGFMGSIAQFIYSSSVRPVREVAIVSAMGLMAGLGGRVFNISGTGLNLYIVLIARSAIGKEAMHSGISSIVTSMITTMSGMPGGEVQALQVHNHVDFSEFVSGQALMKAIVVKPCFVNVMGEFGHKLRRMADQTQDGPMSTLRTAMTNMFQKSGRDNVLSGLSYSDSSKDTGATIGAAFSMVGETTPDTFYENLTHEMMADGFLSRFITVYYTGDRPMENQDADIHRRNGLPKEAVEHLCKLVRINTIYNPTEPSEWMTVRFNDADAYKVLQEFNQECDWHIRKTADERMRQMWNRGHLKAMKIASLCAVGDVMFDNHMTPSIPLITLAHLEWAIMMVRRDIATMMAKMASGEVGRPDDHLRLEKFYEILKLWMTKELTSGYPAKFEALRKNGIIPRAYMQTRLNTDRAFKAHKLGVNAALDSVVKSCLDNGYLVEMSRDKLLTDHAYQGKAYRVVGLPDSM